MYVCMYVCIQAGYFAPVNNVKAGSLLWLERKALLQHLGRADLTEEDVAIFEAIGADYFTAHEHYMIIFPRVFLTRGSSFYSGSIEAIGW